METQPHFRVKILIAMVGLIILALLLQGRAWFQAGDVFFKVMDTGTFINTIVLPTLLLALPIILIISAFLAIRLSGLHKTLGSIASGQKVSAEELKKAQTDFARIPIWIFSLTFVSFTFELILQSLTEQSFSMFFFFNIIFTYSAAGVVSFLLMGIINVIMTKPRTFLKITTLKDIPGKFSSEQKSHLLFTGFLISYALLFPITMGVKISEYQINYSTALERIVAGEDKDTVSKQFFQAAQVTHPKAGEAQNGDILLLKPRIEDMVVFYIPTYLLILIVSACIWGFSTRYQNLQLRHLSKHMEDFAQGKDDGERIEILRNDEIGHLTDAINRMMIRQKEELKDVASASRRVAGVQDALNHVAKDTAQAGEKLYASNARITQLAKGELVSVQEADTRLGEALNSFDKVAASVESQSRFVSDSTSAMTEVAASISGVAKTTQDASTLADQLKKAAQEGIKSLEASVQAVRAVEAAGIDVANLTASIAKVAAQTNLLAMNAAIEAAHAGEAGSGFAVVAQEVRNLAVSSAESSRKIRDKIKEMTDLVSSGARLSEAAGQSFETITKDIAQTAALVSEIASAMQEQNVAVHQVLHSMTSLVDASKIIQDNAEIQKGENARLRDSVSRVLTAFKEIVGASEDASRDNELIQLVVTTLSQTAEENNRVVEALEKLLASMGIDKV